LRGTKILGLLLASAVSISTVQAGGIDQIFYTPLGQRIDLNTTNLSETEHIVLKPKLQNSTVNWAFVSDDINDESNFKDDIEDALELWSAVENVDINFNYQGYESDTSIPYEYETDGFTKKLDSFGNPIISGAFHISFTPPAEISFPENTISVSKQYIVPNLSEDKADVMWGAIYLNPNFEAGSDYNLKAVVAHEMGRLMGLSPSASKESLMFPVDNFPPNKNVSLTTDDAIWAASHYAAPEIVQQLGSISGVVLNGEDGTPWLGAHLELIPSSKRDKFYQTLDRGLAIAGTFSKQEGEFKFEGLPPGEYFLIAESLGGLNISLDLFGEWVGLFGSSENFELEFYDGAGRESNFEAIYSFSPQSIFYAAVLIVEPGDNNSGVSLITNTPNATGDEIITSDGAINEILSLYIPEISGINLLDVSDDLGLGLGDGCVMRPNRAAAFSYLLMIAAVLFLLLLSRQGRKEE
jgi:hypothetical protein